MIWRIVNAVVVAIRWFFLPPAVLIRKIDPSAVCPGCGHRNGRIQSVIKNGVQVVEHTCKTCNAQWWEKPVITDFEPIAASSTTVKIATAAETPKE